MFQTPKFLSIKVLLPTTVVSFERLNFCQKQPLQPPSLSNFRYLSVLESDKRQAGPKSAGITEGPAGNIIV